jgi:hypothetical protein
MSKNRNRNKNNPEEQAILDQLKDEENAKLLPKEIRAKMSVKERNLLNKRKLKENGGHSEE